MDPVSAIIAAAAALITTVGSLVGTAMKNAAINVASIRQTRDNEILHNQQKDLAAYQFAAGKVRADSIIIVAGFVFLGLMVLIMIYKKK